MIPFEDRCLRQPRSGQPTIALWKQHEECFGDCWKVEAQVVNLRFSFELRGNEKFLRGIVVLDPQHVRFAAYLAIFHIALPVPGRFIHGGRVPLATSRTLEAGFHGWKEHTATVPGALPSADCDAVPTPL